MRKMESYDKRNWNRYINFERSHAVKSSFDTDFIRGSKLWYWGGGEKKVMIKCIMGTELISTTADFIYGVILVILWKLRYLWLGVRDKLSRNTMWVSNNISVRLLILFLVSFWRYCENWDTYGWKRGSEQKVPRNTIGMSAPTLFSLVCIFV